LTKSYTVATSVFNFGKVKLCICTWHSFVDRLSVSNIKSSTYPKESRSADKTTTQLSQTNTEPLHNYP